MSMGHFTRDENGGKKDCVFGSTSPQSIERVPRCRLFTFTDLDLTTVRGGQMRCGREGQ